MKHVEWDETLETGDPLVDSQHRGLVELFNELVDAEVVADDPACIAETLERLTEYVVVHFTAEEALMARCGFPQDSALQHVAEHNRLTELTRDQVLDYRSGTLGSVVPIAQFLYDWLVSHVQDCDRRLVEHCRSAA